MNKDMVVVGETKVTKEDIKRYLCPDATDQELYMAIGIINSYGLNPFKREVHIIKYSGSPAQVVVGYEVYLKRAERTGKLDGWKKTTSGEVFKKRVMKKKKEGNTWKEYEVERVDTEKSTLECIVEIYRKDWKYPFIHTASIKEFCGDNSMWVKMPRFLIEKVATCQAFRIAFPDEMGGLPYSAEEISTFAETPQAEIDKVSIPAEKEHKPEDKKKVSIPEDEKSEKKNDFKAIEKLSIEKGKTVEDLKSYVTSLWPERKPGEPLTATQLQILKMWIMGSK